MDLNKPVFCRNELGHLETPPSQTEVSLLDWGEGKEKPHWSPTEVLRFPDTPGNRSTPPRARGRRRKEGKRGGKVRKNSQSHSQEQQHPTTLSPSACPTSCCIFSQLERTTSSSMWSQPYWSSSFFPPNGGWKMGNGHVFGFKWLIKYTGIKGF